MAGIGDLDPSASPTSGRRLHAPLSHPQGVVEQFADDRRMCTASMLTGGRSAAHLIATEPRPASIVADASAMSEGCRYGTVDLMERRTPKASTSEATLAAAFWISSVAH